MYARLVAGAEQADKDKFDADLYAPLGRQLSLMDALGRVG